MNKSTFFAKPQSLEKKWYLIDAKDRILGRLATQIAVILRGKHKPMFTPHIDCGDMVIVINAEKIKVTGKKLQDKEYQRYSGYPSGQKRVSLETMLEKSPAQVLRLAVNRMISRGPLGFKIRKNLRIYAGDQHPHIAQSPISFKVK